MDRTKFFEDFTELLKKHEMDNCLIVYVGHGQVFNTTFNSVENEAASVLNHMSDVINSYFNQTINN